VTELSAKDVWNEQQTEIYVIGGIEALIGRECYLKQKEHLILKYIISDIRF
jgi:hypothetical protein